MSDEDWSGGETHGELSEPAGGPADPVADTLSHEDESPGSGRSDPRRTGESPSDESPIDESRTDESPTDESPTDKSVTTGSTPNTKMNALVGAVVTAATALLIPFAPALGGGVAGYLEGGDSASGLKVGTVAGILATIPLVLLVLLVLFFVPVLGPPPRTGLAFAYLVIASMLVFLSVYVVGLSALGGLLGAYLKREW